MKPRTQRRLLDSAITITTYAVLAMNGAGWWALLIMPYGLWNFYDGLTRSELPS